MSTNKRQLSGRKGIDAQLSEMREHHRTVIRRERTSEGHCKEGEIVPIRYTNKTPATTRLPFFAMTLVLLTELTMLGSSWLTPLMGSPPFAEGASLTSEAQTEKQQENHLTRSSIAADHSGGDETRDLQELLQNYSIPLCCAFGELLDLRRKRCHRIDVEGHRPSGNATAGNVTRSSEPFYDPPDHHAFRGYPNCEGNSHYLVDSKVDTFHVDVQTGELTVFGDHVEPPSRYCLAATISSGQKRKLTSEEYEDTNADHVENRNANVTTDATSDSDANDTTTKTTTIIAGANEAQQLQQQRQVALVCFPEQQILPLLEMTFYIYPRLMIVSVVFLVLVLAIYAWIPELRDELQGKCIICKIVSLIFAYICIIVNQMQLHQFDAVVCKATAYLKYFWFMAAMFWLNVISINVWESVVTPNLERGWSWKKRFLIRCGYAWGCSTVLLVVSIGFNEDENTPSTAHFKPGFGGNNCWFASDKQQWIYMNGPMAILLLINCALFIWSAVTLWKLSKVLISAAANSNGYSPNKQRFNIYLRLFVIMGITWIFEVISFAADNDFKTSWSKLWMAADILNCLQGVLIFVVLILCRKSVLKQLQSKLKKFLRRKSQRDEQEQDGESNRLDQTQM